MLDDYSNLITAFSTAAIAILTVVLWLENRTLRRAGAEPEVAVYLLPHPDGHGGVNFVISNLGRGPAFNVTYKFLYEEDDFKSHHAMIFNDPNRMPITVLPQGEKIRALLGVGFRLYGDVDGTDIGPLKPFTVRMQYYDIFGRKKDRDLKVDIRQFAGLPGIIEKSNERKISESLKKIENHMETIAGKTAQLSAFVDITKINDARIKKAKGDPGSDGSS